MNDPIVEEVRAVRARTAEACDYDLVKMLEHAQTKATEFPAFRRRTQGDIAARSHRGRGADSARRRQ